MANNVEMRGIEFQIVNDSADSVKGIRELKGALSELRRATAGGIAGLDKTASSVRGLNNALSHINSGDISRKLNSISSALSSLRSLDGIKISSGIATQIGRLNDEISKLDVSDVGKVKTLADGLHPLSLLGKSNLTSFIDQLGKLPELTEKLNDADIERFSEQMVKLSGGIAPLASQMNTVSVAFSKLPNNVKSATSAVDQYERSIKSAGNQTSWFQKIIKGIKLTAIIAGVKKARKVLSVFINASNEYQEDLNLFTVSLGKYAKEAQKYAEKVSDVMGIDSADWMRNQGVFNTLITGFGAAADRAHIMSQNLTQLGYDLSSFFNISVADSMQKLQSGISGELEPLRRLGYDLSQAKLQATALSLGIDKTISSMTQAEKAELRYYAIMTQVTTAQGDMARTLESPANQLRILEAQLKMCARAIGNIFIPALNRILPYAIAVVQAIREIADAIAKLLGFKLTEVDYSGVQSLASGAEESEDALDGAAKAAKKLQKYTMGFDELNVIDPSDSGKTGADDAPTGGTGFDWELPTYDFLGDAVSKRLDEIKKKMEPIINWIKENAREIVKVLASVAGGIAVLAGGNSIAKVTTGITKLAKSFSMFSGIKIPALFQTLGGLSIAVAGGIYMALNSIEAFRDGLSAGNLDGMIFGLTGLVGGLALAFGPIGAAAGLAVGGIALLAPAFKDLFENGLNDNNLIAFSLFGTGLVIVGATLGPVAAIVVGATAVVGGLAIALTSDAIPAVEIFDDTISETTRSKVEPFIENIQDLNRTINAVHYSGKIVSDEDVQNVQAKMAQISSAIINELDSDKNEALGKLEPLKAAMGAEAFADLMYKTNTYYNDAAKAVTDGEARINEIMSNAADDHRNLTQDEYDEIIRIQSEMQSTGIMNMSDTAVEYTKIMNALKDDTGRISLEQTSQLIQDAQKARDDTIDAANTQYAQIMVEAQRLLDLGAINEITYQDMIDAAEKTRDDTIAAAEEQYENINKTARDKLGDMARYLDSETAEILSKWDVFASDFQTAFSDATAKMSEGWKSFTSKLGQELSWEFYLMKKGAVEWANFFIDLVESVLNWMIDKINMLPMFDINHVSFKRLKLPTAPALYASGGFVDEGELFIAREAGAEMVGSIGRHTAVANNDQIVEGITAGVSMANEEGNALLRRQNELLLQLLQKDNRVTIGKKDIKRAYDTAARESGVSIMRGVT